jgi:hypothetical protein
MILPVKAIGNTNEKDDYKKVLNEVPQNSLIYLHLYIVVFIV